MKSISRILLFTFLVTEVTSFNVSVEKLSTLFLPYTYSPSEIYDLGEDAAEQMVYDPPTKLLYSVGKYRKVQSNLSGKQICNIVTE